MQSDDFYHNLKCMTQFSDFTEDSFYQMLPSDWTVIITDIRGSTKAIAESRYKEVNTIGAASIVVVRKAMGSLDFPFVFGGDGATLLVANSKVKKVCEGLNKLKALAINNYNLELRIGVVPMSQLSQQGYPLWVAKHEISSGCCIALMKGEGLLIAEKWIKDPNSDYVYKEMTSGSPDLSGLSCRWNPIKNKNGKILTLLIQSRNGNIIYKEFLHYLSSLLPNGIESTNPVNVDIANYKTIKDLIKEERKLHSTVISPSFWFRAFEIIIAVLLFRHNIRLPFINSIKYSQSMRTHSDFRKFDEMLRMVLDCSPEQIQKLKLYLEKSYQDKKLFYGTFEAESSLMTCFVDGLGQGQHIHFIDGDNGGYTSAAVGLKAQLKAEKS
jgi:hypothetical protein